jgi:hypothetical protein
LATMDSSRSTKNMMSMAQPSFACRAAARRCRAGRS